MVYRTARATVLASAGMSTQDTMFVPLSPGILLSSTHRDRVKVMTEKEARATTEEGKGSGPSPQIEGASEATLSF